MKRSPTSLNLPQARLPPLSSSSSATMSSPSTSASSSGLDSLHKTFPTSSSLQILKTNITFPWIKKGEPQPLAFTLDNVLTPEECKQLIQTTETVGYGEALVNVGGGRQLLMTDVRNNTRCMIDDEIFGQILFQRIQPYLPQTWLPSHGRAAKGGAVSLACLNERLRFLRYTPGQKFEAHYDGIFERAKPKAGFDKPEISYVTVQFYLNDTKEMQGGSTAFLDPNVFLADESQKKEGVNLVHCHPRVGRVLVFEHHLLHEGSPVTGGIKYCLRTDAMFQPQNIMQGNNMNVLANAAAQQKVPPSPIAQQRQLQPQQAPPQYQQQQAQPPAYSQLNNQQPQQQYQQQQAPPQYQQQQMQQMPMQQQQMQPGLQQHMFAQPLPQQQQPPQRNGLMNFFFGSPNAQPQQQQQQQTYASPPYDNTPLVKGSNDDPKIVMVLDSSGSMSSIEKDIIGSVNTFLEQQKKEPDSAEATFSLLQFGAKMQWIYSDQPLMGIKPLTADKYQVTGGTPLYDALGDAITRFDYYRDVIMAIITDGQENESRRFTQAKVKEMMAKKKADANWIFIYLSCDEAGFAAGQALGVSHNQQVSQPALSKNVGAGSAMSAQVCQHRSQNYEQRQYNQQQPQYQQQQQQYQQQYQQQLQQQQQQPGAPHK